MATLLEDVRLQETTVTREAELHNAGIKERYRRLRDAEERQFSVETQAATDYTVRASVLAPEKPAFSAFDNVPTRDQVPQVTEYVRERIQTPVFTTEKFQAIEDVQAPQMMQAPVQAVQFTPVQAEAVQVEQYSLTSAAKKAIVAFCAVVTVLTTAIGINTHAINQKRAEIAKLELQRQELIEKNAEVQRRIEEATSEETIREYALSQGMIRANG